MRKRVLTFKAYPYFWKMHNKGEMPFTLRRFDPEDRRFHLLEEDWCQCLIKIRNTETGEWLRRTVKGYEHMPLDCGPFVLIRF
jgi:hypothetical protein